MILSKRKLKSTYYILFGGGGGTDQFAQRSLINISPQNFWRAGGWWGGHQKFFPGHIKTFSVIYRNFRKHNKIFPDIPKNVP
jgi:hypothetical protein